MYSILDFDFDLPEALIAAEPLEDRSASRLLRVDRGEKRYWDEWFTALPRLLSPGDMLVINNTRVFPARLIGVTNTDARVEIFLISERTDGTWLALARPARRLPPGKKVIFDDELAAEITDTLGEGRIAVRFHAEGDIFSHLERIGRTPLPPYIKREQDAPDTDRERYQTVYASRRGAIAAPTAGLHFTPSILSEVKAAGIEVVEVTLHVGYGTFEPVRAENLSDHKVMPESFEISPETASRLNAAKREGRRIIAVGTTTTRTLENAMARHGTFIGETGQADLTIRPGYHFTAIDGLLTNFHLPKSSLLVLVSAFAGRELIMDAYRHAVRERYRFYSYGDCMLIT